MSAWGLDEATKDCPYGIVMLRGLGFEDLHPLPVGLEPLGRLRAYGLYPVFAGGYAVIGLRVYAEQPFFICFQLGVDGLHHLGQAQYVVRQRHAGFGGSHGGLLHCLREECSGRGNALAMRYLSRLEGAGLGRGLTERRLRRVAPPRRQQTEQLREDAFATYAKRFGVEVTDFAGVGATSVLSLIPCRHETLKVRRC